MTPNQQEQELRMLFSQWLDGKGDEQSLQRLTELADNNALEGVWQLLLKEMPADQTDENFYQHAAILNKVYQNLVATEPGLQYQTPVRRISKWIKYAAAGVILLAAGTWYFYAGNNSINPEGTISQTTATEDQHRTPSNKAILTLSNGKQIVLDDSANGQLAEEKGAAIFKTAEGQLVYHHLDSSTVLPDVPELNTVATPRGRTYRVTLPDGTGVWLNASSSITFPARFTGTDRTVSIEGEAYLEVVKNAVMPFRVNVKKTAIDVLGTSFNINAYHGEPVTKTTLLEGSIRVSGNNESRILTPGQQVEFREDSKTLLLTSDVDPEQVIAWKNNVFDFRNEDIRAVMNQVSRWYDIDIQYEGKIPDTKILGMMGRNTELSTLLKSLELTSGIKFRLQGKPGQKGSKIIVQ